MILAEPPPSQGDLHFRLFGFPVRVHPFFWLVCLIMGLRGSSTPPAEVIAWLIAVFVSIVIHELGHAFLQRRYGGNPRIVLHGFGGLAICGDCDRSPRSQILISLAGPMAGFLFAGLLLVALRIAGYQAGFTTGEPQIRRLFALSVGGEVLLGSVEFRALKPNAWQLDADQYSLGPNQSPANLPAGWWPNFA